MPPPACLTQLGVVWHYPEVGVLPTCSSVVKESPCAAPACLVALTWAHSAAHPPRSVLTAFSSWAAQASHSPPAHTRLSLRLVEGTLASGWALRLVSAIVRGKLLNLCVLCELAIVRTTIQNISGFLNRRKAEAKSRGEAQAFLDVPPSFV